MNNAYNDELLTWRDNLDAQLRAEDGWLTLIGLTWLPEGETTLGSDPACGVVLPAGVAPAHAATLIRDGEQVFLLPAPGADVAVNGAPISDRPLYSDKHDAPDLIRIGRISMTVLVRGERIGVRLGDPQNPSRLNFGGRRWFPVDPCFRVQATFVPFDQPRSISYEDVLGDQYRDVSPGQVQFTLDDQQYLLTVFERGSDALRIVFRDATAGVETYGAARFLVIDRPRDGLVDLDFNRAYNPPCAFSEYTTCPLPPRENILPIRIVAGEQLPF